MIFDFFDLYLFAILDLVAKIFKELALSLLDDSSWHARIKIHTVLVVTISTAQGMLMIKWILRIHLVVMTSV
jgi:hypothetical protein